MLLAAIRLIVLVASSEPADASTPAMEHALRVALGSDAQIIVRAASDGATDEALATTAKAEQASLLVVVTWTERQRRASVRVLRAPEGRWTDRELRFDAADAPVERGRAIGFALASMVPDEAAPSAPDRPAAPVPPAAPAAALGAPAVLPSAESARPTVEVSPSRPARPNPLALDASVMGAGAATGYGGGAGGVFAVRVPIAGAFGARGAIGARFGEVAAAQATSRVIVGGLGMTWQPWVDASRRWAVGGRVDALLIHHDIGHLSDDDPEVVHLSRLLPGVDAAIEGGYRFGDRAAVVAALGTEIAMGTTDIIVRQRHVAALTPVRVFSELGIRVSF